MSTSTVCVGEPDSRFCSPWWPRVLNGGGAVANFFEIEPERPQGEGCQCEPFFDRCNQSHCWQWFVCPVHGIVTIRWDSATQLAVREIKPS